MKRRSVKGITAGVLAVSMMAGTPAMAFAQQPGEIVFTELQGAKKAEKPAPVKTKAKSQEVGKVTCTSAGKVNISFKQKVTYTEALKAVITDQNGTEIPCKISKKNKSLLTVSVSGLVKGQKYTLTIEGILGQDSTEAVTVNKEFTAKGMKTKSKVGKAEVQGKNFVILKMKSAAYYKDAAVTVKDSEGNLCDAKIVKKAKGNVKVQIANMKKGGRYNSSQSKEENDKGKNSDNVGKDINKGNNQSSKSKEKDKK